MRPRDVARCAVVLAALVSLVAPTTSFGTTASVSEVNLGPVAHAVNHGSALWIVARYNCSGGEHFVLTVDVLQPSSGALAEGRLLAICTGTLEASAVKATRRPGRYSGFFKSGAARACWLATTRQSGLSPDMKLACAALSVRNA